MKTHVINLLPFNNRTEMSRTEYVIKKVLAFILIFFVAGVLGEAVVIGLYTGMGYDPLHGVMPEGQMQILLERCVRFVLNGVSISPHRCNCIG